jgi:hypothetical protein
MVFTVRPSTIDDVSHLAPRLRQADINEIAVGSGKTPLEVLQYSLEWSDIAMTAALDDVPHIMFGVVSTNILTRSGCPWLLGSDAINEKSIEFLRQSLNFKKILLQRYSTLRNVVDDRNTVSKKWLKWLGFSFSEPTPIGKNGALFRIFEMGHKNV